MTDDRPAVDRVALWRLIESHYGEHPETFLDSLLGSGVLLDAATVRAEGLEGWSLVDNVQLRQAREEGRAEVRAAVEARHYNDSGFCDACGATWPCPAADRDEYAAAVRREHGERIANAIRGDAECAHSRRHARIAENMAAPGGTDTACRD